MSVPRLTTIPFALLGVALAADSVNGQESLGLTFSYLGYSLDHELGADAAQLMIAPLGARFLLSDMFTLDLYGAWAEGKIEREGIEYTLSGMTDTRMKASMQASPWALLSVTVGIPTGESTHTSEQAVVASLLASDLLGFQEATWGSGMSITSSLATAVRAGAFGIGLAGSYSVNSEFEPSSDLDLKYQPGNEARVRVGIDRNIGSSTLTMGGTFMTFSEDHAGETNLFQSGNRLRFDASLQFRAGAGVWTLYAADLWREHGDLTLSVADQAGDIQGDTTLSTASQNLVLTGLQGTIGLSGSYVFRPHLDYKLQQREEADGSDEGSGWTMAVGGDIPFRFFGWDFFPKARYLFGKVKDPAGIARNLKGAEFSGTLRLRF